ncbi:RNA polymerase-associated protein RapA [Thiogranum longum]
MRDFIPGQRWISDAELHMGLGTVLGTEHRTVTILFLATGETRTYAKQTAPLTRVTFVPGDTVQAHEGWTLEVDSVTEQDGLLTYAGTREDGRTAQLTEGELDNFIELSRPSERLFTGQIDRDKWFELRYQTLQHRNRLARSELRGLTGARTSLIPHQLYIAHEVANRYAPRVLLADEVGLGKTIEAGLIIHHQLLTERARRVLIIVPESLVHQWLVEMLRRFNLYFSIFDEQRCQAIEESTAEQNPFHSEQLVLCSLEFVASHSNRHRQALAGDWDLLVVDEAHHLQWSPEQASPEYELVEALAAETRGVLLLTATPEQLGKASHFARLRLLDPDRFPDFDAFVEEEKGYEPVAQAVEALLNGRQLDESENATLLSTIIERDNRVLLEQMQNAGGNEKASAPARQQLVEHLLDRHGTGRILFRNTRATVKGFPQRGVIACPLPLPEKYAQCQKVFQTTGVTDPQRLLSPELMYQSVIAGHGEPDWIDIDPRIDWLSAKLAELKPQKVLVITSNTDTALAIVRALKTRIGIHTAVFHENMSIVERDRAAAFFADTEAGSQVLVCSEIGSEGRNFQFAHHLVLFDLPLNPDLLEQRIGRLDRIGQTETINIHVPYLENSAQALMYHWYQQGLSAFEHTCPAGQSVFVEMETALVEALHQIDEGLEDLPALVSTTQQLHTQMNQIMHRGRDRLLEYNSCRPHIAETLQQRAAQQDHHSTLYEYMDAVFDSFNVDFEEHRENSHIVRPGAHMLRSFPALADDGLTVTFDRDTALANEDMQYLTWEHPMVTGAMDLVLGSELGNTALTAFKFPSARAGTLLLECLFVLEPASSDALQSSRYLPATTVRVVIDEFGRDCSSELSHSLIGSHSTLVDSETAGKIVRAKQQTLRELLSDCERRAQEQAPQILAEAHRDTKQVLMTEAERLVALRQVNPNVREEEISYFEQQLQLLTALLDTARLRLDALRVLIAT